MRWFIPKRIYYSKKDWKINFRESYNYIKCSIMIKVEKYHMINKMKKNFDINYVYMYINYIVSLKNEKLKLIDNIEK